MVNHDGICNAPPLALEILQSNYTRICYFFLYKCDTVMVARMNLYANLNFKEGKTISLDHRLLLRIEKF